MSLRFRRSVKICNGVRLNISKTGVGLGVGPQGARMSVHSSGRKTASIGIPGTGIYYQTVKSGSSSKVSGGNESSSKCNQTVMYDSGVSYTYTPDDVALYQKLIKILTKSFTDCSPVQNWERIRTMPAPFDRNEVGPNEQKALLEYQNLKPKLSEKLSPSKFEQRKRNAYENVLKAKELDVDEYNSWEHKCSLASRVISGEIDAYYDALNLIDPFVELSKLGSDFEFGTDASDLMEVEFCTKFEEIIPYEKLSLTSTGKVSVKKLGKTEMYDITQDYVCSLAIRLAREVFSAIPVDTVIVHADEKTTDVFGNETTQTILSVKFERGVFEKTNFNNIDASDYVGTFLHNEKFLKTKGFQPVDRLTAESKDIRIVPKEGDNKLKKATSKADLKKIELPFGWYTQNQDFIAPRDKKLYELRKNALTAKDVDSELAGLKALIAYTIEYREECIRRGVLFEKYFDETFMIHNGKRVNEINEWKNRISEIEDNYLDIKEAEDAVKQAEGTMREDLIRLITENPGILQKELYSHFNKHVKQVLLDNLYQLQTEGILRKEKSGNSNKLWIDK